MKTTLGIDWNKATDAPEQLGKTFYVNIDSLGRHAPRISLVRRYRVRVLASGKWVAEMSFTGTCWVFISKTVDCDSARVRCLNHFSSTVAWTV